MRTTVPFNGTHVFADSVTQLRSDMRGGVAYCGSHGGVYAAAVAAASGLGGVIFCDAGVGIDQAGIAGLALLDECGIPAATVSHQSARIGDGADGLQRGRISHANRLATRLGAEIGMSCAAGLE